MLRKYAFICGNIQLCDFFYSIIKSTMILLAGHSALNKHLASEINECYLFHGTDTKKKEGIMKTGFDGRLGSQRALFGQGNYFAESSTKADQYAGR